MKTSVIIFLVILIAFPVITSWADTEYLLGPEDVVTVNVMRHSEFSGEFLIPDDGKVNLPGIGVVLIAGKSIPELSSYIDTQLKERLKDPEVSVSLKTQRQKRIYVLGSVAIPGVYNLKLGQRITEAIASAGGIVGKPDDCKIVLMRASNAKQQTSELSDILKADSTANEPLQPGDVVNVQTVKQWPIYVMGQVKEPGIYQLREDNNGILEALALAGGTLNTAALSEVMVTHTTGTSELVNLSPSIRDGEQQERKELKPGDLIIVPECQNRIAVLGYVNEPGYFALKDGQKITLTDALGLSKGLMPKKGSQTDILILRTVNGKQEKLIYDLSKFFKNGDASNNPIIQTGDVVYVPRSEGIEWDSIIRAISSTSVLMNAVY